MLPTPKITNGQNRPYTHGYNNFIHRKSQCKSNLKIFKESLKSVTKQYCAESSICGLKHLVSENTLYAERIIWIITLALAIVCSALLVRVTFVNFYRAPLVTTQLPEGVPVDSIIFPAVGICTNNRISKRAVTELAQELLKESRNKNYNETEMMTLLFGLRQLYDFRIKNQVDIQPLQLHRILGDYDVNILLRDRNLFLQAFCRLTPKCEDLLLHCAWNDVAKPCKRLFDFRLTVNGYCCTFNYLRESDDFNEDSGYRNIDMYKFGNKSSFDFDQGLKVLMKLDESDDFFYNIAMKGAQLQFSDAYDFPDAASGSFAMQIASPNVQMSVLITASFTEASRDIQHIPVQLRKCLFHDESSYLPFYTSSDCYLKCRMMFLLKKCSCTPFNMPKIPRTRTCDFRDIPCLRLYYAQSISIRPIGINNVPKELELDLVGGGISCPMCYPTCSKTTYTYDYVNVNIYPEQMNSVPDYDRMDWFDQQEESGVVYFNENMQAFYDERGANFTGTSIVHIKYDREVADCYGQNVIMKWFDLISNIGSTCGFVTGFSFVSLLEFIYFFFVKLYREIRSRRRQLQGRKVGLFEDISKHSLRPLYWNELAGPKIVGMNTKTRLQINAK